VTSKTATLILKEFALENHPNFSSITMSECVPLHAYQTPTNVFTQIMSLLIWGHALKCARWHNKSHRGTRTRRR